MRCVANVVSYGPADFARPELNILAVNSHCDAVIIIPVLAIAATGWEIVMFTPVKISHITPSFFSCQKAGSQSPGPQFYSCRLAKSGNSADFPVQFQPVTDRNRLVRNKKPYMFRGLVPMPPDPWHSRNGLACRLSPCAFQQLFVQAAPSDRAKCSCWPACVGLVRGVMEVP